MHRAAGAAEGSRCNGRRHRGRRCYRWRKEVASERPIGGGGGVPCGGLRNRLSTCAVVNTPKALLCR